VVRERLVVGALISLLRPVQNELLKAHQARLEARLNSRSPPSSNTRASKAAAATNAPASPKPPTYPRPALAGSKRLTGARSPSPGAVAKGAARPSLSISNKASRHTRSTAKKELRIVTPRHGATEN
jgi:hypothetical protein